MADFGVFVPQQTENIHPFVIRHILNDRCNNFAKVGLYNTSCSITYNITDIVIDVLDVIFFNLVMLNVMGTPQAAHLLKMLVDVIIFKNVVWIYLDIIVV